IRRAVLHGAVFTTRLKLAAVLVIVMLAGCTAWSRDDRALEPPIPHRRPLEIWSGGHSLVAHGVQIHDDSIRAVPRWRSPECDSCVRRYALAAIDSVRVRRFSPVRTGILVSIFALLSYFTYGFRDAGGT